MTTAPRLIYMANQIARNFAVAGEDVAALRTADHIKLFWAPAMRAQLQQHYQAGDAGLDVIVQKALAHMAHSA